MSVYISVIAAGLERDGRVRTVFSGRSMLPTLRNGMRLLVEKIPPEDVRPCDIIMYRRDDGIVAHRVIRIIRNAGERVFITKGDNHAYIDCSYIPQVYLMGIVRSAFTAGDPDRDILISSRLTGLLYRAAGNMVLAVRERRRGVPKILRAVLKYFIGGFFFLFKKFIHAVYMGIYYARLFNGRR
ncbi:MAG: signal peptidase I [Candidatus Omnitrophica bacterium]|nr:signal peptidase I [Candidatus Omnitrophota bacterium]